MFPRNVLFAAVLMVSGASLAQAEDGPATLEMSANGEVQIAPDGHVSDYRLQSKLAPAVASLVDRDVRSWRFEPVIVDGSPVVARTAVHIRLKAEPAAVKDNYAVRIVDVRFGEPQRNAQIKKPQYPMQAVSVQLGARVLLVVRLDETGQVVDVQPYQTSLDARTRTENEAEHWRHMFEKVSVAAARSWRYDLSETINGKPIGTTALVPVEFAVNPSRSGVADRNPNEVPPAVWKAYVPGPIHPASWLQKGPLADNQDMSTLHEGEALSLDSRFHLKSNVIGKTL